MKQWLAFPNEIRNFFECFSAKEFVGKNDFPCHVQPYYLEFEIALKMKCKNLIYLAVFLVSMVYCESTILLSCRPLVLTKMKVF